MGSYGHSFGGETACAHGGGIVNTAYVERRAVCDGCSVVRSYRGPLEDDPGVSWLGDEGWEVYDSGHCFCPSCAADFPAEDCKCEICERIRNAHDL